MRRSLEEIERYSARQLSLISAAQLREAGFATHDITRFVQRGLLRRMRSRVYAIVGSTPSWEQQLMAAVLSAGSSAVASHSSAAALWHFAHRPEARLEVSVPRGRDPRLDGVIVHRTTHLEADDVIMMNGIPRTTFERTLCDCSGLLSGFQLGRSLDDGLRRGVATMGRLEACLRRLESAQGRRLASVRRLCEQRRESYEPGGSAAELHVLRVIRRAGLPIPVQQHRVVVRGSRYELDFAWPEHLVLAEFYGLNVHSGPSAVARDSERLTRLVAAGWTPLVFTDETSDDEIVEMVSAALEARNGNRSDRRSA